MKTRARVAANKGKLHYDKSNLYSKLPPVRSKESRDADELELFLENRKAFEQFLIATAPTFGVSLEDAVMEVLYWRAIDESHVKKLLKSA